MLTALSWLAEESNSRLGAEILAYEMTRTICLSVCYGLCKTRGIRLKTSWALLVGCGLRRSEVVYLTFDRVQQRDGRWVLVDLIGKRNKARSVPMPSWAKQAMDEYQSAANVADGIVFRPINKAGRLTGAHVTKEGRGWIRFSSRSDIAQSKLQNAISASRRISQLRHVMF